jgi:hypothetical protein
MAWDRAVLGMSRTTDVSINHGAGDFWRELREPRRVALDGNLLGRDVLAERLCLTPQAPLASAASRPSEWREAVAARCVPSLQPGLRCRRSPEVSDDGEVQV